MKVTLHGVVSVVTFSFVSLLTVLWAICTPFQLDFVLGDSRR